MGRFLRETRAGQPAFRAAAGILGHPQGGGQAGQGGPTVPGRQADQPDPSTQVERQYTFRQ